MLAPDSRRAACRGSSLAGLEAGSLPRPEPGRGHGYCGKRARIWDCLLSISRLLTLLRPVRRLRLRHPYCNSNVLASSPMLPVYNACNVVVAGKVAGLNTVSASHLPVSGRQLAQPLETSTRGCALRAGNEGSSRPTTVTRARAGTKTALRGQELELTPRLLPPLAS